MLTSLSSNAITAKARAIYGRRLKTADYRELLRQRTVSDVAAYLKTNTSYARYLAGISETQIHRGQLENLLERSRLEKFISLLHFDFSKSRGFYHYAILNVEIMILQYAIMHLNSSTPEEIIKNIPSFMQEYVSFDFIRLSKIKNYSDLLKLLSGTPYYAILKRFQAENGDIDLSACEHELKTFYYKSILRLIDKNYKGSIRRELRTVVLIEVEILNLSLIYRLKRYFKKTPDQIKAQLLPFFYRLNNRSLDAILEADTEEGFLQKIRLSSYNSKMKEVSFNYIEDYTTRLQYYITKKLMRFSSSAPVVFYSLMALTQIELENIIIIIEGIRYNDSPQEIEKLLILES